MSFPLSLIHISKHLRLLEKFYFWAYRIPENGNFTEVDSDCTAATVSYTHLDVYKRQGTHSKTVTAAGAYDLTRPFSVDEVKLLLERVVSHLKLRSKNRLLGEKVGTKLDPA